METGQIMPVSRTVTAQLKASSSSIVTPSFFPCEHLRSSLFTHYAAMCTLLFTFSCYNCIPTGLKRKTTAFCNASYFTRNRHHLVRHGYVSGSQLFDGRSNNN